MITCKRLIVFLLGITVATFVQSQMFLPDYLLVKQEEGNILVRWEPHSLDEWENAKQNGYIVKIFAADDEEWILLSEEPVKNKPLNWWEGVVENDNIKFANIYQGSKNLMYPDASGGEGVQQLLQAIEQQSGALADSFRVSMLSYYSSLNIELAESVGFGYSKQGLAKNKQYKVSLFLDGEELGSKVVSTKIIPSELRLKDLWGDLKVDLNWETTGLGDYFHSYLIERSSDGITYKTISDLPALDPNLGIQSGDKAEIELTDSLEANYKEYFYRVRPIDYFGLYARSSNVVKGFGFDELIISPQIIRADQLYNNEAHIIWEIQEKAKEQISHFAIMRSDSARGEYELAKDSIPKTQFEVKIKMEHELNHFRVLAVPIHGNPTSSFPVFVMGMDTIPPAIPQFLSTRIDTNGIVEVKWMANTESDLWGYKLFYANDSTHEFSLVTPQMIKDTVYKDTVSMKLLNKNIFYRLQAADMRNNRSDLGEIIIVERPDIHPPAKPFIKSCNQKSDSLFINLGISGSSDVIEYELFRRNLSQKSKSWQLVEELDTIEIKSPFIDLNLDYGHEYAYTLRAIDDYGLKSDLAEPLTYKMKEPETAYAPIKRLTLTYDTSTYEVELSWELSENAKIDELLVYRGQRSQRIGKYKYVEDISSRKFKDKLDKYWDEVHYILKPSHESINESYWTEPIELSFNTGQFKHEIELK